MNRVKEEILEVSLNRKIKEKKGQIFLSERERKILKYLQTNPRTNIFEIQEMFNISREMANRVIKLLLEQDLIARRGKGKATYYELV
jgi:predicted transcriptional regulator